MSGGVDSAASAYLLKEAGYDVRGVTLRLKPGDLADADIADAKRAAEILSIPFEVLDLRSEFKKITDAFCREYLNGRTPSPCVFCNPTIKFGELLDFALQNGGDYLATGHYARVTKEHGGLFALRKNPFPKDQSYFLCRLDQTILSHVLFPLGEYSKPRARDFARQAGLFIADKKDSQEVCFIPDNDYVGFIEREFAPEKKPGDFLSETGEVLGRHGGLYRYTVGQRKGLGAFGKPMYVLALDAKTNTVTVGENAALFKTRALLQNLSFVSGTAPSSEVRCLVKIRAGAIPAKATVRFLPDCSAEVLFDEPQRAVSPGQTAAFYDGDKVLGGGVIVGS